MPHDALRLFAPLPEFLRKTFADTWLPKSILATLAALIEYLLPEQGLQDLAVAAGALILLDTATGFWAALVTGKKISSAKFSRVLTKVFGYGSVVVVCGVAAHAIPRGAAVQPLLVSAVLGFVILTEGISILENVGKMGVKAPPWLLDWLRRRQKETPDLTEGTDG